MTKVWTSEIEPPMRRFDRRGTPYSISHDRYMSTTMANERMSTRSFTLASQGLSLSNQDINDDASKRRRIPVACVRCRKRKIKCSGPPEKAGELGCTNCNSAGVDNCQFNRVTSEPVQWRESVNCFEYPYDAGAGRQFQARGGSQTAQYGAVSSGYPYNPSLVSCSLSRAHSYPDLPYQGRHNSYYPNYMNDYGEDATDFGLSACPYPFLGHDLPMGPYNTGNSGRSWISGPQKVSSIGTLEAEGLPSSCHASSYQPYQPFYLRNPGLSDNNFSFSNMASSLPAPSPLTASDRLLPTPVSVQRGTQNLVSLSRTADTMQYAPKLSSHGLSSSAQYQVSLSSSPDSDPEYSTTMQNHGGDMYALSSSNQWATSTVEPSLRSHGSTTELFYHAVPGGTTGRKHSTTSNHGGAGSGGMVNPQSSGHAYVEPYVDMNGLERNVLFDAGNVHVSDHKEGAANLRT